MDTTMSIKRRRLLGAAAASLALPAFTGRARRQEGVSRMTTQSNYLAVRPDWLASALEPVLGRPADRRRASSFL